jgi:hypothetical protein
VNIGGMPAILPCHFHDKKSERFFENQPNLELDDKGGDGVPPSGCGKLGYAKTETGPLGFSLRC